MNVMLAMAFPELLEQIKEFSQGAPWLMFVAIFVATFVSEDLACVAAGILAAEGIASWAVTFSGAAIGIWVGDVGLYWIGRGVTNGALQWNWAKNMVTKERVERGKQFFDRFGIHWIMISRCLPGSRVLTYIAAGASHWSFTKFSVSLAIAAILWVPILSGLSYYLGPVVISWLELLQGNILWILLAGALILFLLFKYILPSRTRQKK